MVNKIIESDVALKWLEEGNRDYMDSIHNHGDISKEKRIYIYTPACNRTVIYSQNGIAVDT